MALFHADTTVGGNGSDYTDDDNASTGLMNGGSIIRIVPMFQQVVNIALWTKNTALTVINNVTLSQNWATLTTGLVDAIDYSSKAWAVGGTGVDTIGGSAKDWAVKLSAFVGNTSDYSAKEYATGTTTESSKRHASGTVATGSAKDWATKTSSEVVTGQGYGAKKYANDAAQSAIDATNNGAAQVVLAANQVTLAAAQVTLAENKYDQFDDRYLGSKTTDPTTDNDGNALITGAMFWHSVSNVMKVWSGSSWSVAYVPSSGFMLGANNLSDLTDKPTAINNLGCLKKALFFAGN